MNNNDYSKIKLLVLDVDGVMTDGRITFTMFGDELKWFHVHDGAGMKYWKRAGGKLAIITGRKSDVVKRRAKELGVDVVLQNHKQKLPALKKVLAKLDVSADQTAVMGDDMSDLPLIRACGFSAAPSDAVEDIKPHVDYVCRLPGGGGCVREVVELLLKGADKWDRIMARYSPVREGNQE